MKSIKNRNFEKIWFIELGKIKEQERFKVFYFSFDNLEKILENKIFEEIPDPDFFVFGVYFQPLVIREFFCNSFLEKGYIGKKNKNFKSYKISGENHFLLRNQINYLKVKNKSEEKRINKLLR